MKKNHPEAILWDFDGVIIDSMSIRDMGFREVLSDYPVDKVNALVDFHRNSAAGLSRYIKFKHFFEKILGMPADEGVIKSLAERFSAIMLKSLINREFLIKDSLSFIEKHHKTIPMHIVSGSDEKELKKLSAELGISGYFKSLHGSPTPKEELISELINNNGYKAEKLLLVGDSSNDWDAAKKNGIIFWGYNNQALKEIADQYILSFTEIDL